MKKRSATFFFINFILLAFLAQSQVIKHNLFVRTPQVVNYNLSKGHVSFTPVISVGTGISYKSYFLEVSPFITSGDIYGFYTFFGKTIKSKSLSKNLRLHTNWFGEVSYVPSQPLISNSFTHTTGICFFLNYGCDWGSIGIPMCMGFAFNKNNLSLNTRTILNLSLNLN